MIKSMTGYGKAECEIAGQKLTVEIRSVNGKSADITLKTQFIPKDIETSVRNNIASILYRGNIDVFCTLDQNSDCNVKEINMASLAAYYRQLCQARDNNPELQGLLSDIDNPTILQTLMKMPDIVDVRKSELTDDDKAAILECISQAAVRLDEFRTTEGTSLERDFRARVANILEFVDKVEGYEAERIETVRNRILSKLSELPADYDKNRLEQEMIYYIEKLDINEEKVRLRQHCRYFLETFKEDNPGKKLGFIAQEMGREINTMGSKANHVEIQKIVVRMKDELEKIKEQTLNTL